VTLDELASAEAAPSEAAIAQTSSGALASASNIPQSPLMSAQTPPAPGRRRKSSLAFAKVTPGERACSLSGVIQTC
jgi:hypothetical protein